MGFLGFFNSEIFARVINRAARQFGQKGHGELKHPAVMLGLLMCPEASCLASVRPQQKWGLYF